MKVLNVAATMDATATRTGRRHSTHYHVVVMQDGLPVAACNRNAITNYDGTPEENLLDNPNWFTGLPLERVHPDARCRRSGCRQRWPKKERE